MNTRRVLIFTDKPTGSNLRQKLEDNEWEVFETSDLSKAKELSECYKFNVAFSVLDFCNDQIFLDQLEELICSDDKTNWILILPSDYECDLTHAPREHKLINEFCFDYHRFPVQLSRLLIIMGHAYGMAEMARLSLKKLEYSDSGCGLIGNSPPMINLGKKIKKIAKEDLAVLIQGETGTGKELIAKAIHDFSSRKNNPFIAVNCGTLPESLVQTELFGHEKGAFTGAHKSKIGRLQAAEGGTLFLDEIGDLPLSQQVNLLRFLEEKTILRVGGEKHVPVDVRIIAATNVDLDYAIKEGEFREDLYFRLKELHLNVPPLREREGDVELLARYFFDKFSKGKRKKVKGFSLGAMHVILNYSWPGNVRELSNAIQKAVVMSENRLLSPDDLDLDKRGTKRRSMDTLEEARAEAERSTILASLRASNFNITRAAEKLEVSRVTLHRLMDKYNIKNGS
ncbi:MAG: sigma 54-interacting transcriptional regulator [Gammaproteobacteria bacterium]